jgi:hypothetical protein
VYEEFEKPTPLDKCESWKFWTALDCRNGHRRRGTIELLFCMLRAKHSDTNNNKE